MSAPIEEFVGTTAYRRTRPIAAPPCNHLELGKDWCPHKVESLDLFCMEEARGSELKGKVGTSGGKRNLKRLARDAKVRQALLCVLLSYYAERTIDGRAAEYKNRETPPIKRLLKVMGVTESLFLSRTSWLADPESVAAAEWAAAEKAAAERDSK